MKDTDIFTMFLHILTEYDYEGLTEAEAIEDFNEMLSMAIVELQLQGLMEDNSYTPGVGFEKEIDRATGYILAHACCLIWIAPKVNSSELLAHALTSTDFTMFSPTNRLTAALKLQSTIQAKLDSLIADYDTRSGITTIKKRKETSGK